MHYTSNCNMILTWFLNYDSFNIYYQLLLNGKRRRISQNLPRRNALVTMELLALRRVSRLRGIVHLHHLSVQPIVIVRTSWCKMLGQESELASNHAISNHSTPQGHLLRYLRPDRPIAPSRFWPWNRLRAGNHSSRAGCSSFPCSSRLCRQFRSVVQSAPWWPRGGLGQLQGQQHLTEQLGCARSTRQVPAVGAVIPVVFLKIINLVGLGAPRHAYGPGAVPSLVAVQSPHSHGTVAAKGAIVRCFLWCFC